MVSPIRDGISAITLPISLTSQLVGSIGVMNVMRVAVREQGPEIGIRRALGASRRHNLTHFLAE